jgi:hypothetical protein
MLALEFGTGLGHSANFRCWSGSLWLWSVQGLAFSLVRTSLAAISGPVLFKLLLQWISIGMLMVALFFSMQDYPALALGVSAIAFLASLFILERIILLFTT